MIPYPKIGQFKDAVHELRRRGVDGPVRFKGTVKLHGTNGGIRFERGRPPVAQSRNRDLSVEDDNMEFAAWVRENEHDLMRSAVSRFEAFPNLKTFVIYGEWAGEGIQKGVAISKAPRGFWGFEVLEIMEDGSEARKEYGLCNVWVACIRPVAVLDTWEIDIDMSNPEASRDRLVEITLGVEDQCPAGVYHGIEGTGEGVVWTAFDVPGGPVRFKVKGEKHSATKVRKLASVDEDAYAAVALLVDSALTERRFEQGLEYLSEMGKPVSLSSTGDFIKWVQKDVLTEEAGAIEENGFQPSDVAKAVGVRAARWFKSRT